MDGDVGREVIRVAAAVALAAMIAPAAFPATAQDGDTASFHRWEGKGGAPGRLLRHQPWSPPHLPQHAGAAHRILYSSTSDFGGERDIVVSGVLYLPTGQPPRGGWPLVTYGHGTVGSADVCAPSIAGPGEDDSDFLDRWLTRGFAVVATDYEGLGTAGPHPYMGLGSAARTMLDAVRAIRGSFPISGDLVAVGHSQGAHAAFGAGLLQPAYAPDVPLAAVIVSGLPGEAGFRPLDERAGDKRIAPAIPVDPDTPRGAIRRLAMDKFDPWFAVYLHFLSSYRLVDPSFDIDDWLAPPGRTMAEELARGCSSKSLTRAFAEKPPLRSLLRGDLSDLEESVARLRRYPEPRFAMPVYVGIGRHDELTAPELSFNVARVACLSGSSMTVDFYDAANHRGAKQSLSEAGPTFAKRAIAGLEIVGNCAGLRWPGRDRA